MLASAEALALSTATRKSSFLLFSGPPPWYRGQQFSLALFPPGVGAGVGVEPRAGAVAATGVGRGAGTGVGAGTGGGAGTGAGTGSDLGRSWGLGGGTGRGTAATPGTLTGTVASLLPALVVLLSPTPKTTLLYFCPTSKSRLNLQSVSLPETRPHPSSPKILVPGNLRCSWGGE